MDTVPLVGSSWPERIFRKVDLPAPLAPGELQVHVGEQGGALVAQGEIRNSNHVQLLV